MEHNLLKRLQEIFLEVETSKFFLDQEFICKLSERVNGKDGNVEVFVGTDMNKVFTQHLPDPSPHESDSCHVKVSDLNESLQTELARVN